MDETRLQVANVTLKSSFTVINCTSDNYFVPQRVGSADSYRCNRDKKVLTRLTLDWSHSLQTDQTVGFRIDFSGWKLFPLNVKLTNETDVQETLLM